MSSSSKVCSLVVLLLANSLIYTSAAHLFGLTNAQEAEETCCKEGPKLIMDVIVCDAPCCPGLREWATDDAPHLGLFVTCQAERDEEEDEDEENAVRVSHQHAPFPFQFRKRKQMNVRRGGHARNYNDVDDLLTAV